MWGVVSLIFLMFQGLGDPAKMLVGQTSDSKTLANIRKEIYLDKPIWQQYFLYLNDVSPVSVYTKKTIEERQIKGFFWGTQTMIGIKLPYLRKSYQTKKPVGEIIKDALPGTIMLAVSAMSIAIFFGIFLGIIAALNKGTWLDTSSIFISISGISVPSFLMAIVLAFLFGALWHQYTGLPLTGSWYDIDIVTGEKFFTFKNLILPAITLGIRPLAVIAQLTRSSMIDVMQQDYIRTAFAKGLNKRTVVWKHALRNCLNPLVTTITGWLAELLAGAFFVEYIFGWKGIGKITVDALEKFDYPVVMGSVLLSAFVFIIINLGTDVLYKFIDPRVK